MARVSTKEGKRVNCLEATGVCTVQTDLSYFDLFQSPCFADNPNSRERVCVGNVASPIDGDAKLIYRRGRLKPAGWLLYLCRVLLRQTFTTSACTGRDTSSVDPAFEFGMSANSCQYGMHIFLFEPHFASHTLNMAIVRYINTSK